MTATNMCSNFGGFQSSPVDDHLPDDPCYWLFSHNLEKKLVVERH